MATEVITSLMLQIEAHSINIIAFKRRRGETIDLLREEIRALAVQRYPSQQVFFEALEGPTGLKNTHIKNVFRSNFPGESMPVLRAAAELLAEEKVEAGDE